MTKYDIVCDERLGEDWEFVEVRRTFSSYKDAAEQYPASSELPILNNLGYTNIFGMYQDNRSLCSPTFQAINSNIFRSVSSKRSELPKENENANETLDTRSIIQREPFGISCNHEIGYSWNRYTRRKNSRRMHSQEGTRTPVNSPTNISSPTSLHGWRGWFRSSNPFESLYNSDTHSEDSFASESPTREYWSD